MTIMLAQLCYLITLFSAPGTPPQIAHVPCPVSASPTPSPTAIPTTIPTFTPSASPIPTLAPTATPTAPPTIAPTPVPTQTPISTTPAALLCVHFAANPMCKPLPASPAVIGQSASWAALEFASGHNSLGGLQISNAANPYLDSYDDSEPRYELPVGANGYKQTVNCSKESYSNYICGTTGMNGKAVTIPVGAIPAGVADHHLSYDDFTANGEFDFWESDQPSNASTLYVGGAGFCKWGTDGTGCSGSTATGIATGLGAIDATLLQAAEADPHGSLPFALSSGALCDDVSTNFVYPAKSSDGDNSDSAAACAGHTGPGQRPPEGTRWFLAMHDADINATNNAPYVKVILRTLDEDHMGAVVTDTNWNLAPEGFNLQFNRGNYAFAAAEAGIAYGQDVFLPITTNGINLPTAVTFCNSGTC